MERARAGSFSTCDLCLGSGLTVSNCRLCGYCEGRKCIACNETGYESLPLQECSKCCGGGYISRVAALPATRLCDVCTGAGLASSECRICRFCEGRKCMACNETGYESLPFAECDTCGGRGEVPAHTRGAAVVGV